MARRLPLVVLALAGALALGGCLLNAADSGAELPDDVAGVCFEDSDCALAGPSCCACPSDALPVDRGFADACAGVECPMPPSGCAPLVARCAQGTCTAACAPVACEEVCPSGFVVDPSGCLACACAAPSAEEGCMVDGDCVRAPADCCGCERGGNDTAVPAAGLAGHLASLMCAGGESCPGVQSCTAGAEPRCQLGRCVLAAPTTDPGAPAGACGRPELPPCPAGEVCAINDSDEASPLGVGVCRPAP